MKRKNVLKLVLDFCMVITLTLMYNKMVINLTFHELGGLILIGVMLIHVLINWKWVAVISKRLYNKTIPLKTKLGYLINTLLLIAFLLIGLSGIMISKILFQISVNSEIPWKTIHYSASSFALILIGIHLGLHTQFIFNKMNKINPIPQKIRKMIGVILSIVIVSFGGYFMVNSSFISWLLMPFSVQQMERGFEGGRIASSDRVPEMTGPETNSGENTNTDNKTSTFKGPANHIKGNMQKESGGSSGIHMGLYVIFEFFSIIFVFSVITFAIEKLLLTGKKRRIKS